MPIQEVLSDLTALGGLPVYVAVSLMFFALEQQQVFWQLLTGLVAGYVITFGIRFMYHKERPVRQPSRNVAEKIDAASFPSFHSTRATILAIILMNFFLNPWITSLFAVGVVGVGVTRVVLKRHYISDVLVGILIGTTIGLLTIRFV